MAESRPVVLVGGAGFIGRALAVRLASQGVPVVAVVRHPVALGDGIAIRAAGTLTASSDWPALLSGARAVVHLASRAHAPLTAAGDEGWIAPEAAAAGTLARVALETGADRVILLSSIKIHGEATRERPFRAVDAPAPEDAYGRAKLRIEAAMRAAAGPRLVVLRPPLVYGPDAKANFLALLRLVDRGLPLPLASVANRRSLIFLGNLLDLIEEALRQDAALGETFLLRDDDEPSTPALIAAIARHLGRPARLFPCPPRLLRGVARLAGRSDQAERLLGSLQADDGPTRARLAWQPRFTFDAGIAATCRWFREAHGTRRDGSPPASPL